MHSITCKKEALMITYLEMVGEPENLGKGIVLSASSRSIPLSSIVRVWLCEQGYLLAT